MLPGGVETRSVQSGWNRVTPARCAVCARGLRGGGRPSCGAASRSGGALAGGRGWSIRGAISPRAFGPRWLLARSGTGSGNAEGVGPVPRPVRTPTAQPHDKAPVRAFSALGSGDASLRAEPRRPRAAPCGRGRSAFSAFSPATDHCVGRSALFVLACVPRQVIRSEAGAFAPVVPGTPQLPRTGLAQSGSRQDRRHARRSGRLGAAAGRPQAAAWTLPDRATPSLRRTCRACRGRAGGGGRRASERPSFGRIVLRLLAESRVHVFPNNRYVGNIKTVL